MTQLKIKAINEKAYNQILNIAFNNCEEFILVIRDKTITYNWGNEENHNPRIEDIEQYNEKAYGLLSQLKPFLIKSSRQHSYPKDEWQKTNDIRDEQTLLVYYYKTISESKKIILNATNHLFSWCSPNLPDDLCFLKNGNPWLTNIAHEKLAWFENLSNEEFDVLERIDGLELEKVK